MGNREVIKNNDGSYSLIEIKTYHKLIKVTLPNGKIDIQRSPEIREVTELKRITNYKIETGKSGAQYLIDLDQPKGRDRYGRATSYQKYMIAKAPASYQEKIRSMTPEQLLTFRTGLPPEARSGYKAPVGAFRPSAAFLQKLKDQGFNIAEYGDGLIIATPTARTNYLMELERQKAAQDQQTYEAVNAYKSISLELKFLKIPLLYNKNLCQNFFQRELDKFKGPAKILLPAGLQYDNFTLSEADKFVYLTINFKDYKTPALPIAMIIGLIVAGLASIGLILLGWREVINAEIAKEELATERKIYNDLIKSGKTPEEALEIMNDAGIEIGTNQAQEKPTIEKFLGISGTGLALLLGALVIVPALIKK